MVTDKARPEQSVAVNYQTAMAVRELQENWKEEVTAGWTTKADRALLAKYLPYAVDKREVSADFQTRVTLPKLRLAKCVRPIGDDDLKIQEDRTQIKFLVAGDVGSGQQAIKGWRITANVKVTKRKGTITYRTTAKEGTHSKTTLSVCWVYVNGTPKVAKIMAFYSINDLPLAQVQLFDVIKRHCPRIDPTQSTRGWCHVSELGDHIALGYRCDDEADAYEYLINPDLMAPMKPPWKDILIPVAPSAVL